MALGCFIITTKHAGIPDIITTQNGDFVEAKSPKQIYQSITSTPLSRFNKVSDNNIKSSKKYTEEAYLQNLINVFNG